MGGPNGKLLNGNVGSSRRGGRTEIGGPSLMTVELGAEFRVAHCAPISLGPTRYSPSLLLPSAVFFHRRDRPAAQREKIRGRYTLGSAFVSRSDGAQRVNFEVGRSLAAANGSLLGSLLAFGMCLWCRFRCRTDTGCCGKSRLWLDLAFSRARRGRSAQIRRVRSRRVARGKGLPGWRLILDRYRLPVSGTRLPANGLSAGRRHG